MRFFDVLGNKFPRSYQLSLNITMDDQQMIEESEKKYILSDQQELAEGVRSYMYFHKL